MTKRDSARSTAAAAQQAAEDKIVIAVDFGTTFSGVATVYSATPDEVDIIRTWPGGNGITSDKVPTEISYQVDANTKPIADVTPEQNPISGATTTVRWGFMHKPEELRIKCMKLFLDRNQKLPHFVSPLETATHLRRCDRTVKDAVSDFLSELYKHTLETLTRRYGEAFMATTPCSFVITVPAVWSDAAKNATLQAAERAGMGKKHELMMISEPEAAAVYALKMTPPKGLIVGSNFVVCDAGGGTVDLIAYKVTSLYPLLLEESAVGTGGLCGSAFIDFRFEEYVKERLGFKQFNEMKRKKPKTWTMGLRYFEEFVKRTFNEDESGDINIPMPGLPDDEAAGIDSGFLVMNAAQVKKIFEPVINQVLELVQGQVDAVKAKHGNVTGIILVGGFGQSNHLYTKLKQHFNTAPPPPYTQRPTHENGNMDQPGIEILQPLHAWTAVVRGAALRGVEGSVVEKRRSRLAYGTSYATVFDEKKHPASDRYWSPLWERWMVSDRMQWHIAKGAPISSDEPISFHYTRNFRPGQSLIVEDDLIACEEDNAPDAYNKNLVSVCKLKTDLSAVPQSLFTTLTTSKGQEFSNLDFELHMKIQSANLVFELIVDGVKYGSVQAEFQ
ncbi:hypothetical protein MBLNU13_g01308t2 [Cladosporium sp. NU13]